MSRVASLVLVVVVTMTAASCSSSPEDSLASDMCQVLTAYMDTPDDEASVFDTADEMDALELRGRADGVNMDQVGAKLILDCTDGMDHYEEGWLNASRELENVNELLEDLVADLEE